MRLICPNCSAQYEIDATMIPDEGRDVQCSNCGHTWFELPPPAEAEGMHDMRADAPEPEPETYDEPVPETEDDSFDPEQQSMASKAIAAATDDISDDKMGKSEPFKDVDDPFEAAASEFVPPAKPSSDASEDEPSKEARAPSDDDFEDDEPADIDLSAIAPTTLKARRPSDAADVDLLREEAQRELTRRAAPSASLESQTDLGLEGLTNRKTPSRALRARMARSSGAENTFEDTQPTSDDDYQEPQRDLLPDIDEINSTLNQNDSTEAQGGGSGFRLGFGLTVLLCVAAIFAYIYAPNIANAVPGAESALLRYVDLANQLRDWIDSLLA